MPTMFRRRLPKPEDPGDEGVLADIRKFGFHTKHVRKGAHPEHLAEEAAMPSNPFYEAGLTYTVGLPYSHGHPELAVVGPLADDRAHGILWEVVHLIESGRRFAAGDESDEVLAGYPTRFGPVSEYWRKEVLTFADWAARRKHFEALQILLPDKAGRFPDDPAYDGVPQPLLG
jgi:Domain of unknown function (DUF4262)